MDYDAELRDWSISYKNPGRRDVLTARGVIAGDNKNRFMEAYEICTSPIKEFDIENMIITTRNTRYKLL